ncbi:hypothetical protein FHS81_000455 [Pseudochelatococcus contaminans]|uniref:Uncharacterized protein n=1 Tax=Pseudochelatococcus contaminans TaxID=1538103 RepID=A0A7W6EEV8_9HYPH|nr:hypothetical protein [Pseudochelatococcus contaminans]
MGEAFGHLDRRRLEKPPPVNAKGRIQEKLGNPKKGQRPNVGTML